jgi:hypothetical protein
MTPAWPSGLSVNRPKDNKGVELPYMNVMDAAEGYAFDAGTCLKLLVYEALSY